MQLRFTKIGLALALGASLALAACQPALPPVGINDVPVYPGAVELSADAPSADDVQVQEWLNRDARDRRLPPEKIVSKRFHLPKDLNASEFMSFYSRALQAAGWQSRWGSVPTRQAFTRGAQTLVLYVLVDQTDGATELLMTLDR